MLLIYLTALLHHMYYKFLIVGISSYKSHKQQPQNLFLFNHNTFVRPQLTSSQGNFQPLIWYEPTKVNNVVKMLV